MRDHDLVCCYLFPQFEDLFWSLNISFPWILTRFTLTWKRNLNFQSWCKFFWWFWSLFSFRISKIIDFFPFVFLNSLDLKMKLFVVFFELLYYLFQLLASVDLLNQLHTFLLIHLLEILRRSCGLMIKYFFSMPLFLFSEFLAYHKYFRGRPQR